MDFIIVVIYMNTVLLVTQSIKSDLQRAVFMFITILVLVPINIYMFLFSKEGLLVGKPDQYGYLYYATQVGAGLIEQKGLFMYIWDFLVERNFHNVAYWIIYSTIANYSILLPPQVTMRFINYLALIGIFIIARKTVKLLELEYARSYNISMYYILSTIYVIRDILMLSFFSLSFYFTVKMYIKGLSLTYFIAFMSSVIIIFLFRGHLALAIAIIFIALLLYKVPLFRRSGIIVPLILFFVIIKLISTIPLNIGGFEFLRAVVNSYTSANFVYEVLWRIPIYISGLSFLDPTVEKVLNLPQIVVSRMLSIDSIIVPMLIVILYMFRKHALGRNIIILRATIISFIVYFSIYICPYALAKRIWVSF